MNFDITFFLTLFVLISGIIVLLDKLLWKKQREQQGGKQPWWIEYARSFFPVLLLVWVVRGFIVQPYRVPTGSLEPTIMPGDFILSTQYSYGLRLPVLRTKFLNVGEPKRGQIILFHWPVDPKLVFVKRVIGIPGDHIQYKNKVLYINGKKAPQTFIKQTYDLGTTGNKRLVLEKWENLDGVKHKIWIQPQGGEWQDFDLTVPKKCYFVMGDNRDNSDDSRQWGFVPEKNLIGKGLFIWFSWDPVHHDVRWGRIGNTLEQ